MDIKLTKNGTYLCYESYYGTYFRSSYCAILETMYNMNGKMVFDDMVSMRQIYESLELPPPPGASSMGWNGEYFAIEYEQPPWIDFYVDTSIAPNGEPCITLNYVTKPINFDCWDSYVLKQ